MSVLVLIEDIEDVIREFARVTEGEELLVYSAELCLVQLSTGAVFQEALVPIGTGNNKGEGNESCGEKGNKKTIVAAPAYRLVPE